MTILDEIQVSIARLAEESGSSVVGIGQRWGVGSGIVLGDNRVLTNAHNVRGSHVTVTFADGHTAEGTVAGTDVDGDLAVVEVETGQAPVLPWATTEEPPSSASRAMLTWISSRIVMSAHIS
jgi:S1-C subfamily serine protease